MATKKAEQSKQYTGDQATQGWNHLARRLSGVLWMVGMCWELLNREWKVWMPLCRCKRFFFPGPSFLADWNLQGRQSCNEMSRDDVVVCHSCSTLYMMSYITFLQALRHNFCTRREWKQNRPFTRPFFPVKMVWERDYPVWCVFVT